MKAGLARPRQQFQAPYHREHNASWELVRGCHDCHPCLGRCTKPSVDDQTLPIDRDGVRPHLGQQKLRMGQGVAGVLDPRIVRGCQQDPDGDVDCMLSAWGDDNLLRFAAHGAGRFEVL